MSAIDFWAGITAQLQLAGRAMSAQAVVDAMPATPGISSADGFFGGSGGDESLYETLSEGGWVLVWAEAEYYWCMRAPDGSLLTYIEGDLYLGNRRPLPAQVEL